MCICEYVYICVCVHVHVCGVLSASCVDLGGNAEVRQGVYVCLCMYVCMYVRMYVRVCVFLWKCAGVCDVFMCMCVCVCVCVCVRMCACAPCVDLGGDAEVGQICVTVAPRLVGLFAGRCVYLC